MNCIYSPVAKSFASFINGLLPKWKNVMGAIFALVLHRKKKLKIVSGICVRAVFC